MKTQNIYSCPIERRYLFEILTKESPAHRAYRDKNGIFYDLTNAVDFLCKERTRVRAALCGEVVTIINNLTKNYNERKPPTEDILPIEEQNGNYVILKHENAEFSMYSHLMPQGVTVSKEQFIETGEIIGYSGNTGWSIVPNLNLMVFKFLKPKPARDLESLEIRWK